MRTLTAAVQREPDVAVLRRAVQLAAQVAAGDPVVQLARHLDDGEPGAEHVEGEPDLDALPAGERLRDVVRRLLVPVVE